MGESEEIHGTLVNLSRSMGRVEAEIPALTAAMNAHANAVKDRFGAIDKRQDRFEARQGRVEKRQAFWSGGAALLAFATAQFVSILFGRSV